MAVITIHRPLSVREYHRMARSGHFDEDDRVELLNGEIVEMSPISSRHAACVDRLTREFSMYVHGRAIVRVQNPVQLSKRSEPQPDIALLRPRDDFYRDRHPTAKDVFLIIEVAETSVEVDREVKLPLYAKAGVPEVWIIDLHARAVEIYTHPGARGYARMRTLAAGAVAVPQAFPDVQVEVGVLL